MVEECCSQLSEGPWEIGGFLFWQVLLLAVVSFAIGILGGVVGAVLGILRLPFMLVLGGDPGIAAATNLFTTMGVSWMLSVPAIVRRQLNLRVALLLGGPGLCGSFLGGYFSDSLPLAILFVIISFFLTWSAISMIRKGLRQHRSATNEQSSQDTARATSNVTTAPVDVTTHVNDYTSLVGDDLDVPEPAPDLTGMARIRRAAFESSMGFIIGVFGGAVGLALGVVRLPAMINYLDLSPREAVATNLFVTALVSMFGLLGHLLRSDSQDNLEALILAAILFGGAFGGMLIGRHILAKLSEPRVRVVVGAVLLAFVPVLIGLAVSHLPGGN